MYLPINTFQGNEKRIFLPISNLEHLLSTLNLVNPHSNLTLLILFWLSGCLGELTSFAPPLFPPYLLPCWYLSSTIGAVSVDITMAFSHNYAPLNLVNLANSTNSANSSVPTNPINSITFEPSSNQNLAALTQLLRLNNSFVPFYQTLNPKHCYFPNLLRFYYSINLCHHFPMYFHHPQYCQPITLLNLSLPTLNWPLKPHHMIPKSTSPNIYSMLFLLTSLPLPPQVAVTVTPLD